MEFGKKNSTAGAQVSRYTSNKITRQDFPEDFVFGAGVSAYQVEGGYAENRRALSNWDCFSMRRPGKISDGSNGCVAIDQYNRFKDDVKLMKKIGIDAYRLSISWSRILPGGRLSEGLNLEGVKFYNDLIDTLLAHGIEPYVTIFQFDLPQCLEDEYGGFLSERIVPDFAEYAQVCFFQFGDRVKHWITLNEPWTYTSNGYITGGFPPGHAQPNIPKSAAIRHRASSRVDQTSIVNDPSRELYIVAHNLILSHAAAVDIYRQQFQAVQGGKIGVVNMTAWFEPLNDDAEDIAAASRALDFMWGWFVSPIVTGDYPPVMRERVKDRLPTFSPEQAELVKGSFDFMGMNYYTSNYAKNYVYEPSPEPTYYEDQGVLLSTERDGVPIGPRAGSEWLYIVPIGIYKLLTYTKNKYGDPLIFITENGVDEVNDKSLTTSAALKDDYRIDAIQDHLSYVKQALDEGVNVKTYFVWSMFDNFEWSEGYTVRFGLYYVDYENHLVRYPKKSALWFMNFLNKRVLPPPDRKVEETAKREAKKGM